MDLKWVRGYNGGTSYEWPGNHGTVASYGLTLRNYGKGCWRAFLGREATEEEIKAGSASMIRVSQADATSAAKAKEAGHTLLMAELKAQGIRLEPARFGGWIKHRIG